MPASLRKAAAMGLALFALASACGRGPAGGIELEVFAKVRAERSVDCAAGWSPANGGRACDAVLPEGECPAGTMPVIGSQSCRKVPDLPCPAGFSPDPSGWGCVDVLPSAVCEGATREALGQTQCQPVGDCAAAFPPASATHFVDDSYAPTQLDATHFQSISAALAAALAAAPAGAVVAVEAGSYTESLEVSRAVSLIGRCAAQVVLLGAAGTGSPGVNISAGKALLRGFTLKGHFNGANLRSSTELELSEVVLESNQISGVRVGAGAHLVLRDSVVRDGVDPAGNWGLGLYGEKGASLEVSSTALARNRRAGVVLQEGTTGLLEGVVVRQTSPRSDGSNGNGVVVVSGAKLTLRRSALLGNRESGLLVEAQGALKSTALVEDTAVRDTRIRTPGVTDPRNPSYVEYFGWSVSVHGNASAEIRRSFLLGSGGTGLAVAIAPATAKVSDSVLKGVQVFPNGYPNAAVAVQEGGTLELLRSAVVGAPAVGVQTLGASSLIADSVIADTERKGAPRVGHGVQVGSEGVVEVLRSAIVRSAGSGVLMGRSIDGKAAGSCSVLSSVISGGRGYADGSFGRAADIAGAGTLQLSLSALVRNRELGIRVAEAGTLVRVSASVVRDTQPDGNGNAGRAINVQQGGRLELTRSLLSRNRDVALLVGQVGSSALVADTAIAETLPRAADQAFGLGVAVLLSARADLARVLISGSPGIGLAVSGSAATVQASTLESNAVALHAQDGSVLSEVPALPEQVGPLEVLVTADTKFADNQARVGTGVVPLPTLLQ
ncbi:MAG: hypothetical protein HYZ28_19780 [Myxococcales bacterium]|nr:hypothetical protein [Myxococcales bacterium]